MTKQHRSNLRTAVSHPVIPITSPVYDEFLINAHPRLQLHANVTFYPKEDNDQRRITLQSFLRVYAPELQNTYFEEMLRISVHQLPQVSELHRQFEEAQARLDRALEANNDFLKANDTHYQVIVTELQHIQDIIDQNIENPPRKAKERRRMLRRAKQASQSRIKINEILQERSSALPHPIKKSDVTEASCCMSIEELQEHVRDAKKERDDLAHKLQRKSEIIQPILIEYLTEMLDQIPTEETIVKLVDALAHRCFSIYELEDGFGEDLDIQTDDCGLPIDAERIPISVNFQVLKDAYESGEETVCGDTFAFFPKQQDGSDPEPNAIVGSVCNGYYRLVILPPRVIKVIFDYEEKWIEHFTATMNARYLPFAPTTEAKPQEQQEPVDIGDEEDPTSQLQRPDETPPQPTTQATEQSVNRELPRFRTQSEIDQDELKD